MKLSIVFCIITLSGIQYAYSMGHSRTLTKPNRAQKDAIDQLILKMKADSVTLNTKRSQYETYQEKKNKPLFRLDNEIPTADKMVHFSIQSLDLTFGTILVKPGIEFKHENIQKALTKSVVDQTEVRLESLEQMEALLNPKDGAGAAGSSKDAGSKTGDGKASDSKAGGSKS